MMNMKKMTLVDFGYNDDAEGLAQGAIDTMAIPLDKVNGPMVGEPASSPKKSSVVDPKAEEQLVNHRRGLPVQLPKAAAINLHPTCPLIQSSNSSSSRMRASASSNKSNGGNRSRTTSRVVPVKRKVRWE